MVELNASDITFDEPTNEVNASEITFDDAPKPKKEEPFLDLTYLLAGAGKNITLAPSLAGLVGAAYETASPDHKGVKGAGTPLNPLNWSWKDMKKRFGENLDEGMTKSLVETGSELTKGMTDFLGVNEIPTRTGNQVLDILGTFITPVSSGFLGGTAAKGIKGTLGRGATLLASPVRMGPKGNRLNRGIAGEATFGQRATTSAAIGGAFDQTVRYGLDEPTLLSNEALYGESSTVDASEIVFDDAPPTEVLADEITETDPEDVFGGGYDKQAALDDQAVRDAETSQQRKDFALTIAATFGGLAALKYRKKIAQAMREPAAFGRDIKASSNVITDNIEDIRSQPGLFPKVKRAGKIVKNAAVRSVGRQINSQDTIDLANRAAGVEEDIIKQLDGIGTVDSRGQIIQFLRDGKLDFGETGISVPMKELKRTYDNWDAPKQEEFITYIAAGQSNFTRTKATAFDFVASLREGWETASKAQKAAHKEISEALEKSSLQDVENLMEKHADIVAGVRGTSDRVMPDLWSGKGSNQKTDILDPELREALAAGNANPEFKEMRRLIAKNNEAILQNSVDRGVIGEQWAESVKRRFTVDSELLYIPGKSADELQNLALRIMRDAGLFGSVPKNQKQVANLRAQATKQFEGISSYLDPFNASGHYQAEMLDHTNRSVAQLRILEQMLDMEIKNGEVIFKNVPSGQEAAMLAAREKELGIKLPQYIGRISSTNADNIYDGLNFRFRNDKLPDALKEKTKAEIKRLKEGLEADDLGMNQDAVNQMQNLENALIVQHKGDYFFFAMEDKFLRNAMEFDTTITNGFLKNANFLKRAMTAGTTGKLSNFAWTSFIYNASIGSINTFIREKGGLLHATKEAVNVWTDGIKSATDIFSTQVAQDFADQLAHTLATGVGFGSSQPALVKAWQKRFADHAKKTMMDPVIRTTGGIGSSGTATSEFVGNLNNVMAASTHPIYKSYGANALPQFARIWSYFNGAMHEGVALGATLRHMRETGAKTAGDVRQSRLHAANKVGNTKLQGSSDFAHAANASVPFYGAMMQAFYTLGKAYVEAGPTQFATRMSLAIGIPAALEAAYNSALMPDEEYEDALGNKWSYKKYYWKGFSPEQRANNHIVFKPGFPPWEAVLQPIVPELAVFKGLALDAMDAVFNLSGIDDHVNFDHAKEGFNRVFNIPSPIQAKVFGTMLGDNLRLGPQFDEDGFSIATTQQQSRGNRVTPDDQVRYEGQEIDTKVVALLNDIFGSLGRLFVDFYENASGGGDKTTTSQRVTAGLDSLGHTASKQFRTSTGLFSSHPNLRAKGNPAIAQQVFKKKDAIKLAQRNINILSGQGTIGTSGIPIHGSDTQTVPLDPIAKAMGYAAKTAAEAVAIPEEFISQANAQISSLKTSLYNNQATKTIPKGNISIFQRDQLIDAYTLKIAKHHEEILNTYKAHEATFGKKMSDMLGRPVKDFTFDGYVTKPNPSSASREPR